MTKIISACAYTLQGSSVKVPEWHNTTVHCHQRPRHKGLCRAPMTAGIWIQWKKRPMPVLKCDFVTLRTNSQCKNRAVWIDRPNNSTKVCGTHKAKFLQIRKRGEPIGFVRLDHSSAR